MGLKSIKIGQRRRTAGFTLVEVIISSMILGITTLALFGSLSSGFSITQSARENLRATQIMLQRAEAVRLFNWSQVLNTNYLKPTFTESYDTQTGTNGAGTSYSGFITSTTPTNVPSAYAANMRTITISLYWTNTYGKQKVIRSRQMQTQVARYGMQNYIWGANDHL